MKEYKNKHSAQFLCKKEYDDLGLEMDLSQ